MGCHQHAVRVYPGFHHGAGAHVLRSGGKAVLQHARDLLIGEAIRRLHINARFHTAALLFRTDGQKAIRIHRERHPNAGSTGCHGGNAPQFEACQAAAVLHQIALPLHHMDGESGLPVFVGGEVLCLGRGDGFIASHDPFHQAAHGFNAQRQRDHVQQQQVACGVVPCELVGLDGCAERHDLVRVQVGQWFTAEKFGQSTLNLRHAGRAAHHHNALHLFTFKLGVTQCSAHSCHGARGERGSGRIEICAIHIKLHVTARQIGAKRYFFCSSQGFLAGARCQPNGCFVCRALDRAASLGHHPVGQRCVIVVAPQGRIATRGNHLEHTLRQAQDRNIEGTAAQVIHRVHTLAGIVQPVGNGSGSGFVDKAQQIDACQLGCILGRLALGIVEVRRHRDDSAVQIIVEGVFGPVAQRCQDLGADLYGGFHAVHRCNTHHAAFCWLHKFVGQLSSLCHILQTAAHEALDRRNRVARITGLGGNSLVANLAPALPQITHYGGE